jgi:hypothetical protein
METKRASDESREFTTSFDYSGFDVMGPLYPEPDYSKGKPLSYEKAGKDIKAEIVGYGGTLFDHRIGMRLYHVKTNKLVLVDAEEVFKYGNYTTCSYTWKSDPIEQDKLVNEIVHRVAEMKTNWIWIDAWCIDQSSEADKSFNIQLMGRIYRYSGNNFVMLIDSVVDEDVAEALGYIGNCAAYYLSTMRSSDDDKRFISRLIEEAGNNIVCGMMDDYREKWDEPEWDNNLFHRLIAAMVRISSHRWVTRMWTLQEATLAQRNYVVGANWTCLYETFEYGTGVLEWYCNMKHKREFGNSHPVLAKLVNASRSWRRLYHLSPDITVGEIIQRAAGRACGLQEDRVYAIKGLLPYGDQIEVTYGHPDGPANAAYALARECSRNGDYSWAGGFNIDGFPGSTGAIGIPGITIMPRWIRDWKPNEGFKSALISSSRVDYNGRICQLEPGSHMLNAVAWAMLLDKTCTFQGDGWEHTLAAASTAILAAFGAGRLVNGFLGISHVEDKWNLAVSSGRLWVTGCTQEEVNECAKYLSAEVTCGKNQEMKQPASIGRVVFLVSLSLQGLLPDGCKTAGIVRVPRHSQQNGHEMTTQLSNLLYWPLLKDLTNVRAVALGEMTQHETFALVRTGTHGILHRVGSAIALTEGRMSEYWGERQPLVEGARIDLLEEKEANTRTVMATATANLSSIGNVCTDTEPLFWMLLTA